MARLLAPILTPDFMRSFLLAQQASPVGSVGGRARGVALGAEASFAYVHLRRARKKGDLATCRRLAARLAGDPQFDLPAAKELKMAFMARAISESRSRRGRVELCPGCGMPTALVPSEVCACEACGEALPAPISRVVEYLPENIPVLV